MSMICIIRYSEPFSTEHSSVSECVGHVVIKHVFSSVCADLIRGAKEKSLKVKGPVRMPTKVSRLDLFIFIHI